MGPTSSLFSWFQLQPPESLSSCQTKLGGKSPKSRCNGSSTILSVSDHDGDRGSALVGISTRPRSLTSDCGLRRRGGSRLRSASASSCSSSASTQHQARWSERVVCPHRDFERCLAVGWCSGRAGGRPAAPRDGSLAPAFLAPLTNQPGVHGANLALVDHDGVRPAAVELTTQGTVTGGFRILLTCLLVMVGCFCGRAQCFSAGAWKRL